MNLVYGRRSFLGLFIVIVGIVAGVTLIDSFTSSIPPMWDGEAYYAMAQHGMIGNKQLIAPFAYRMGLPLIIYSVSSIFGVSTIAAFSAINFICACLTLFVTWFVTWSLSKSQRIATITTICIGLSFYHLKFPLYFYTMVDIAAYPLIILAFYLFIKERYVYCIILASVGLLFKEFMIIPLILSMVRYGEIYYKTRQKNHILMIISIIAAILIFGALPRLGIPVVASVQSLDIIHDDHWYNALIDMLLNFRRHLNIIFSLAGYWLPTLMLLTKERSELLRRDLKPYRKSMIVYAAIIGFAAMFGGTNIPVFISYSVGLQILILSFLLNYSINWKEIGIAIVAIVLFNRIFIDIPSPTINVVDYLSFYGGYNDMINAQTFTRFIELYIYGIIIIGYRYYSKTRELATKRLNGIQVDEN